MKLIKEIFLGKEKSFTPNVICFHIALIVMSFVFVYFFSYTTSFRYVILDGDSSIFQSVGKLWAQGHLPYVELFESKGPLMFLIDAIGYMIYPRSGIMVPQIIFMYVSLLFAWRITEILNFNKAKLLVFGLTVFYYVAHYHAGNHINEYNMPFLMVAVYIFLRDLNSPRVPLLHGFIYGFGFGASVLLRTTSSMPICCCVFLSAIFLLKSGELKNLLQNVLSFCAGFAVIVLPFVIYFAAHGALYEMIYGTILFSIKYMSATPHENFTSSYKFIYVSTHVMPMVIMAFASLVEIIQGRKSKLIVSGFFIGVMMTFLQAKIRPYVNYYMIIVPLFPLFVAVFLEFFKNNLSLLRSLILNESKSSGIKTSLFERFACKFFLVTALIFLSVCANFYLHHVDFSWTFYPIFDKRANENAKQELEGITELKKIIPENERDSFVTWGDHNTTTHWVIYADMKSRERLFMNNGPMIGIDPALWIEWFGNVTNNPPLWILYGTRLNRKPGEPPKPPHEIPEIEQFLSEKYILKGQTRIEGQMMNLYRLKE